MDSHEACPVPEHLLLRDAASALEGAGHFAWVVDRDWRVVFMSEEGRVAWASRTGTYAPVAVGNHLFSSDSVALLDKWRYGLTTVDLWRDFFGQVRGMVLHDTAGGRDALRGIVDPSLVDLVDELVPSDASFLSFDMLASGLDTVSGSAMVAQRVRDTDGDLAGTVMIGKPLAGMSALTGLAWYRDPAHLERMERFTEAGRYPAALLFADLEGSSELSRSMSTAGYVALGRRLIRAADRCVVDAGGLVGRHVGDGVVAFFPAVTSGSETASARACIEAARSLRTAIHDVARHSDLDESELVLRLGLHWGSTLYIGRITTTARTEVTALGDQVNEAARIEACATGGRTMASKDLIERLGPNDAAELGLEPERIAYTRLSALTTATDKAQRDAPAIAVCDV